MPSLSFVRVGVWGLLAAVLACDADERPAEKPRPKESIALREGDVSGALRESPDGKLRLKVCGLTAQVYDLATGRPVGDQLAHERRPHWAAIEITCWAFSPDGKLLATGAGFREHQRSGDTSVGQVRVWEVATGRLVAEWPGREVSRRSERIGYVKGLAFSRDGKTLRYEAEPYDIDGP